MKPTLGLKTSQQLALTPQLQHAIKLLQMSTVEFKEELEQTVSENPMLEIEENANEEVHSNDLQTSNKLEEEIPSNQKDNLQQDDLKTDSNENNTQSTNEESTFDEWSQIKPSKSKQNNDEDSEMRDSVREAPISLKQHLQSQLSTMKLSQRERVWVEILIQGLDPDGYLREELKELELPFAEEFEQDHEERLTEDELQLGLTLLQSFDPIGVGARNLSECLKIQLQFNKKKYSTEVFQAAVSIVQNNLTLLAQHNISGLVKATGFNKEIILTAEQEIRLLNPKPGALFKEDIAVTVIPDTIAFKDKDGFWNVKLNDSAIPKLKINQNYARALQSSSENKGPLTQQLQEARWMLKNIRERFDTILRVSKTIVEVQQDFFEFGPRAMRPLVLRDVAARCELHESTVSRVTNQKYISTPMGCFELKSFFGSHVTTEDGGVASATSIKEQIKEWIKNENAEKPFSDQNLSDKFSNSGVMIARRTVAKYREALKIPSASIRKRR